MIAYQRQSLDHLYYRKEALQALEENVITDEEYNNIYQKYPVDFYTPNIFIQIGLSVVTFIILLFSFGLLTLMFADNISKGLGGLAIFFAVICFTAAEVMISTKKHYHSGVDDALQWCGAIALFCGICLPHSFPAVVYCTIAFIICLFCSLRYADKLMMAIAYFSLLGILFYLCSNAGNTTKAIVPFIIMVASLVAYIVAVKVRSKKIVFYYRDCLKILEITTLISLYAGGNYFVVRELSNEMFALNLQPNDTFPLGWLFWIFTCFIPIIYLLRGIQKKDTILIRVSILLFAAIVFTIRYYHTILPIEVMMTIAGILLLAITYGLMKWLYQPFHGFTSREISSKHASDKMNIEALILAQTFKPGTTDTDTSKFGGGNFGGGGAGGDF